LWTDKAVPGGKEKKRTIRGLRGRVFANSTVAQKRMSLDKGDTLRSEERVAQFLICQEGGGKGVVSAEPWNMNHPSPPGGEKKKRRKN